MLEQALIDLLNDGAKALGLELSEEALARLSLYIEELLHWSPRIDLVSQRDPAEIIRKHILDSLAAAPHIPEDSSVVDLGSGAGLPGLPIAILLPQVRMTLLEVRRKRVSFLRTVARAIKLPHLTVEEGRAESLASEPRLRNIFDVAITRATWNTETFLRYTASFLREKGIAIAMKGPMECQEASSGEQIGNSFFQLLGRCEYQLPFGQERRRLLIFSMGHNVSRDT
jgi:16S rRNA (guanine527-N7)-methyltransferase